VPEGSPTVRRRELGALLRKLREEKGLSVKDVTEHLLCSPSKVSRIETGQRGATLRDVRDLCDLYGVSGPAERDHLMTLARQGKQQGWWQHYDLPYSTYVGMEAEAVSIKDYDSAVIPGLLQTNSYARAMFEVPLVEPGLPDNTGDIIEQRVEARMRRQTVLERDKDPLQFWAILDEAALHRIVGSAGVMSDQLDHVIRVSQKDNVTVQIIPYSAGAHPAMDSTFNIIEFGTSVNDLVYVEGLQGLLYIDRSDEIERYRQIFKYLSNVAFSSARSLKFLAQIRDSYALGRLLQLPCPSAGLCGGPVNHLERVAGRHSLAVWDSDVS